MSTPTGSPRVELPVNPNDSRSVLWWGMWGIIATELIVFISLITGYFYLRFYSPEWPLGGIAPPDPLLATIGTVILITSVLPTYWADRDAKQGRTDRVALMMGIGFVLAAIFLGLKIYEYSNKGYNWSTNAYTSIVWAMVGFHSAHMITLLIKSAVTFVSALRNHFSRDRNLGIRVNGLYWYFVVLIWLPLYLTIYLAPRIF